MSVTVTYKCDRCGVESNTHEHQWNVHVIAKTISGVVSSYDVPNYKMHVCRDCLEALGLAPRLKKTLPEGSEIYKTTFEDIVREVVREELNR